MKQSWGQHRAVWDLSKEQVLLDAFDKTRQNPALRTDRGLKARGWDHVAEQVNDRCKSTFNVDQLKSKSARLMMDYELFKDVGGERSISDEDWDKYILEMPENAKRLQVFKESGFPHVDVCRRIASGKDELTDKTGSPHARVVKRSIPMFSEVPDAKKACINAEPVFSWGPREEKLLLFLSWRAKIDREKSGEQSTRQQVWIESAKELNNVCKTNFDENQFKEKYVELMHSYANFKGATGFSGDLEMVPKTDKEWDQLIQDRPKFSPELQRLKKTGGFQHVDVCSLIAGDQPTDEVEPASVNEFLVTGALRQTEVKNDLNTQSVNAVASAQASLSTTTLSQQLPAAANSTTQPSGSTGSVSTQGSTTPAVMTQELHDNLNMFLKTATAYLVMLINDRNHENK
ncbi:Hypothetical protein PHPALM_16954 [Phytophthora palmivora]|uniref:Myb/SANT-like domain-containing protein n=1 Tax=Phytophthora palmivora TaxID=4796 RepID=A0A2P4XNG0_9STRA|nr:Hypothetical protein PHPALM_16954 [Phytophthora palmivora]